MTGTTTIAGRYRIEGRLGVGGMSTVHLAFDNRLERYVAIKLLAEHLADDPTFVSRFRREALAAARLVHPNIVQVFDFGFDAGHHQHFIVMEHVPGNSCAELLRDHGPPATSARRSDVVTQACRGLEYAHRNGVVHRDVKPGNLLVSDSGVVKLADFGIARATDQSSITQVGSVLGTAAYLSPEQARGDEAGPRADLYSLGVVTYQLISGRLPYEANSLSELALKQQRESPMPLDELNPDVPRALAARRLLRRWPSTSATVPRTPSSSRTCCATAPAGSPRRPPPRADLATNATTPFVDEAPTAATRVAPQAASAHRSGAGAPPGSGPARAATGRGPPRAASGAPAPPPAEAQPRFPAADGPTGADRGVRAGRNRRRR